MGNRGILHDDTRRLQRRWAHKTWIICVLDFKDRHRQVMTPHRYTELFFFDEAAAIAAGHRPCFECRRRAALEWQSRWPGDVKPRAGAMDRVLHAQRTSADRDWRSRKNDLPDGTFILFENQPHLIADGKVYPWQWSGYGPPRSLPATIVVSVLTPPASVHVLENGYKPILHPSIGCNN